MSAVQVDPDALDATAAFLRQTAADIDGLRVDFNLRTVGLVGALEPGQAQATADALLAMVNRFLVAERTELAGMSDSTAAIASVARRADGSARPPGQP